MDQLKWLIIGKVWPEPDSSAAGYRMNQLIHLIMETGGEVIFGSSAQKSEYSQLSSDSVTRIELELNSNSFHEILDNIHPDIVLFDRFMTEEQFGWRVRETLPNAVTILNCEDLHGLREARRLSLTHELSNTEKEITLHNPIAYREAASIFRCDGVILISKAEMQVAANYYKIPEEKLYYLPFLWGDNEAIKAQLYQDTRDFVTIGNFRHGPNADSVTFLKEYIWPGIHDSLPDKIMHVYGAYENHNIRSLNDPDSNFNVRGRAKTLEEAFSNKRILLAPLRFGAGLKGKIFDAFRFGVPVVTTSVGAEGYELKNFPGIIADTVEEFTNAAIRLYKDEHLWSELSLSCRPYLFEHFRKDTYLSALSKFIEKHIEAQNRPSDFLSEMIGQQSLQASRYLSKWIEEKNKKLRD